MPSINPIKDSFNKVKEDMQILEQEIQTLNQSLSETRTQMKDICEILSKLIEKQASTHNLLTKTLSTHPSTVPQEIGGLKPQNLGISTGNEGVPTDRQTHQQTDISTQNSPENPLKPKKLAVDNAAEILDSLDSLKKEIRLKFKRLTEQEWRIFSTLYQIEEQEGPTDYKTLANRLKLTESSIRDYIGRLIKKGIPVEKNKINNKAIQLSISKNLKKIASLPTIIQLRDL